jgi:hypothetical protein
MVNPIDLPGDPHPSELGELALGQLDAASPQTPTNAPELVIGQPAEPAYRA